MAEKDITTIKLKKETKKRIDKLRVHARESYDEIAQRMLGILNSARINPEGAQNKLREIERQKKAVKG